MIWALDPHRTTYQSNLGVLGVRLRKVATQGPSTLGSSSCTEVSFSRSIKSSETLFILFYLISHAQAFAIAEANNINVRNQIMGAETQEDEELAVHLQNREWTGKGGALPPCR